MHTVIRQGMNGGLLKGLYSILHYTARLMAASTESPGKTVRRWIFPVRPCTRSYSGTEAHIYGITYDRPCGPKQN